MSFFSGNKLICVVDILNYQKKTFAEDSEGGATVPPLARGVISLAGTEMSMCRIIIIHLHSLEMTVSALYLKKKNHLGLRTIHQFTASDLSSY